MRSTGSFCITDAHDDSEYHTSSIQCLETNNLEQPSEIRLNLSSIFEIRCETHKVMNLTLFEIFSMCFTVLNIQNINFVCTYLYFFQIVEIPKLLIPIHKHANFTISLRSETYKYCEKSYFHNFWSISGFSKFWMTINFQPITMECN